MTGQRFQVILCRTCMLVFWKLSFLSDGLVVPGSAKPSPGATESAELRGCPGLGLS